ncbi:spinster family MFS transporter [Sphingobium naphthae]|uniref:spinster family MFS transporter n=1 Tax=Sphingobium naphthae TaxID=1886786 RepID=UPI00374840B8
MTVQTGANRYIVLFLLSLVYMLNYVDRQIIAILAQPIKQDLNLTDTELGFLSGFAFALVYTILGVPIAWLADRGPRVRIVAVACTVWSLFTMLCGAASSFTSLALARAGVGIGESGGVPPSHSLIADYFPPEKRGFAIALHSLGLPLGATLGISLGGGVAALYGWRTAFLVVGAPGILAAIALAVFAREPTRGATDERIATDTATPSLLTCLRTFRSSPVLRLLLVAAAAYSFVFTGFASWAPSMLMRAKGMSLSEIAAYYSLVSGGAMALGMLASGILTARFGRNERAYLLLPAWAMVAGLPFFVFGLLANAWTTTLACLAIPMITSSMYLAPATALVQNNVPPNQRSAAAAILLLVLNLFGTGLGPLFIGAMSEALTPRFGAQALIYALLTLAPFFPIAAGTLWLVSRSMGRTSPVTINRR